MNREGSKKSDSRSTRTPVDSARLAVAGGARGASGAPDAGGAPSPRGPAGTGATPRVAAMDAQGSAWWPGSSPARSDWGFPPGGFVNFLQQPHPFGSYPMGSNMPENFHLVGGAMSHSSMSPTPPCSKVTLSPTRSSAVDQVQNGSQERETINIEEENTVQHGRSDARSDRRLNWTNEEDVRLVSAWLHNSIDPIDGNDKKADQYWISVTSTYNSTTKCHRMRNRNQLKLRWERIKKSVTEFNGCYARITKVHQSGMSDDQKMDQALQLYASEHTEKPFSMMHVWRILRHEKKWSAYVKKLNKEKDKGATPNPAHVMNVEDSPKERPIGHKKAKDERNGKRKAPEAISAIGEKPIRSCHFDVDVLLVKFWYSGVCCW